MVAAQTAEQGLNTAIPRPLALLDLVLSTEEQAAVQVLILPLAHTGEVLYSVQVAEAAGLALRLTAETVGIGGLIPLEPQAMVVVEMVPMVRLANLDVVAVAQVVLGHPLAAMVVCQAAAEEEWATLPQVLAGVTERKVKLGFGHIR